MLRLEAASEYDVAKIIDSLVECAERRAVEGDETAERMLRRLADRIEDALTEAVGDGPSAAERVEMARQQIRDAAASRRRLQRR